MNKNKFELLFEEMMNELTDVEITETTETCELCNHPFESSEAVF